MINERRNVFELRVECVKLKGEGEGLDKRVG